MVALTRYIVIQIIFCCLFIFKILGSIVLMLLPTALVISLILIFAMILLGHRVVWDIKRKYYHG